MRMRISICICPPLSSRDCSIGALTLDIFRRRGTDFLPRSAWQDAEKAVETYDGVPLDGRPLKITMMTNIASAAAVEPSPRTVQAA